MPASIKSLVTVLIETPHTRVIERRDDPSTKRLRIWTRFSNGSLFMPRLIRDFRAAAAVAMALQRALWRINEAFARAHDMNFIA
jgi:hypothetical protein